MSDARDDQHLPSGTADVVGTDDAVQADDLDLADYDAPAEDDADDSDGSVLRVDISDDEGPLLTGGGESSDSVAPRPGRDA